MSLRATVACIFLPDRIRFLGSMAISSHMSYAVFMIMTVRKIIAGYMMNSDRNVFSVSIYALAISPYLSGIACPHGIGNITPPAPVPDPVVHCRRRYSQGGLQWRILGTAE